LDETCDLSQATAVDEFAGLPPSEECVKKIPDMDLWDPSARSVPVEEKVKLAKETEREALTYDSRMTNSEGADFSHDEGRILYANSHGFVGEYVVSSHSLSVSPVATEPETGNMQRDYWYSVQRKLASLEPAGLIGRRLLSEPCAGSGPKRFRPSRYR
jgi:PmbA protein